MLVKDPMEFGGTFWLPTHPESEKLRGTLRIESNGAATLDLLVPRRLGSFTVAGVDAATQREYLGVPFSRDVPVRLDPWIVGNLDNGDKVALKDCLYADSSWVFLSAEPRMKIEVRGYTVMSRNEIDATPGSLRLARMRFSSECMSEWFDHVGLDHELAAPDTPAVTANLPRNKLTAEVQIAGRPTELDLRHRWSAMRFTHSDLELRQGVFATLSPGEPQGVEWFIGAAKQFADLIRFAAFTWNRIDTMVGYGSWNDDGSEKNYRVFFADSSPASLPPKVSWARMMFTFNGMSRERLVQIVQGWFDLCHSRQTRMIRHLHFTATLRNDVLENKCVDIAAALGRLAGRGPEKEAARAAYSEIGELLESDGECRAAALEWFRQLERRDLFGESKWEQFLRLMRSCEIDRLLGEEECEKLARGVATLRQKVVYGSSKPDLSLYWKALAVLDVCVLARLGFEYDEIWRIVVRCNKLGGRLGLAASEERVRELSGLEWITRNGDPESYGDWQRRRLAEEASVEAARRKQGGDSPG